MPSIKRSSILSHSYNMTLRGTALAVRSLISFAVVVSSAISASAQGSDRFFVGAGIGVGVDDFVERASQSYPGLADSLSHAWIIDGGWWVTPRLALAGEVFKPPPIATGVSRAVQTIDETESETAALASVAVRAYASRTVAVDVVAGGGVLVLDRQIHATLSFPTQHEESDTSARQTNAAFLIGIDGPLHALSHLDIVPLLRLYRFNRDVPGSLVQHSSVRFTAGAVARVTW